MTSMIRDPEQSKNAGEIAAAVRLPATTASKILKMLARGGLVVSLRGAKGGYLLARPAGQISLADIIHAMDGPIGMTECSVTPGLCSQESGCIVRTNWQRVNQAVLAVLRAFTLDQMIEPAPKPVNAGTVRFKGASRTKGARQDLA